MTQEAENRIRMVLEEQMAKAREANPNVEEDANRIWPLVKPTARSGDRPIRPSKPKDGRAAYVWRMLRFHLGEDYHLPVMADTYVSDALYEDRGVESYFDLTPEERKELYQEAKVEQKKLDAVADFILATRFPIGQFNAARRWGRAFYGSGY